MKIKADLIRHLERLRPSWCQVEKVVELSGPEFDAFLIDPQEEQAFLADSAELMHRWDGVTGCVLVLAGGRPDGVLVDSEGTARARYAAYLPQARSILNAELERAADHIVHHGTEHTASGYWCVYCEELAEKFGLIIPEGSGLDTMLKETLERRPEVAAVEIGSGAIETTFHPEFCKGFKGSVDEKKPGLRVRDVLPLLMGGGLVFLTHEEARTSVLAQFLQELTPTGQEDYTALLDARVAEIYPSSEGLEVVLTDVAPEELERFNEDYENFQDAEQAMGDMTP